MQICNYKFEVVILFSLQFIFNLSSQILFEILRLFSSFQNTKKSKLKPRRIMYIGPSSSKFILRSNLVLNKTFYK